MTRSRLRPSSRPVSQSWGRATSAVRARCSGSCSASQRQLADGDRGQRHDAGLRRPPVGAHLGHQRVAWGALRTSFQSSAGRTGSPAASRVTRPCCWPPTETAAQCSRVSPAASSSAAPHARGSTSVPSGWAAEPGRDGSRRWRRRPPPPCRTGWRSRCRRRRLVPCPHTVCRARAGVARDRRGVARTGRARSAACGPGPALVVRRRWLLHAEARLEAVELGPQGGRQRVAELVEPLLICGISARPLLGVDRERRPDLLGGSGRGRRCRATPGSARGRSGSRRRRRVPSMPLDDPLEHAASSRRSPATGSRRRRRGGTS